MALTRKFLSAMGIEEDKIDEIINAHTETVNGLKDEIDKYKEEADKLPAVQEELAEVKKSLTDKDKSPYKSQYEQAVKEKEELQAEFDNYKADVASKETLANKTNAYRKLLKEAGVSDKRLDAVLKVTDVNELEINEDGTLKDAETLTENIKSEWADFIATDGVQGAEVPKPETNTGGSIKTPSLASQLVAEYRRDLYGGKEN